MLDSSLFSAFSFSHTIEIGHRQSRPVDECSEEQKREGLGREKSNTGRNLKIGERENAKARNTVSCILYSNTSLDRQNGIVHFVSSPFLRKR